MDTHIEIAIAVIMISIVMFIASLLFHDKEGDKPARLAFRVFYFSAVLFFVVISINVSHSSALTDFFTDVFVALTNASLTLGILWRCKSKIPDFIVFSLAIAYFFADFSTASYSVQIAYTFNVICSLICVHALLNREGGPNTGDKGMALVILIHSVLLIVNLASFTGAVEPGLHNTFMIVIFVFAPAYMAGLTIFLFASYMLDARKELEIQATTDPLTNLYNRRFFLKEAKRSFEVAKRQHEPLCIMMCDIDHFKNINDNYGHKIGDSAIKEFSAVLQQSLRAGDILARYGGEEFVALLPQTAKEKALNVAERMRFETENLIINTEKGDVYLTASFGVCQVKEFEDIETSINQADKAMYDAKSAGRNMVKSYDPLLT